MKEILLVDLKISLALAAFFVVYKLAFGYDTFFVRNRFFLLAAIIVSFIAPWLRFVNKVYIKASPISYLPDATNKVTVLTVPQYNAWHIVLNIALAIYLLGVAFYMVRFVWAYHKVIRLILKSEKKKLQDLILVITRLSITPFSLLKWLVVPSHQLDHPGFENIVQHESIHCRQYHSVDLFLAELMVTFQWFNPFAWWLKRLMVENHEFIVDREILQSGMDSRKYQYLLLHMSTGSYQAAGVNYFNTNLLKKRICMMNKTKSPRWYGMKNSMILISIAAVVTLTSTFETKVIAQGTDIAPLVIINGKKSDNKTLQALDPSKIQKVNVLKDSSAVTLYGIDAKNGVVEVTTNETIIQSSSDKMGGVKVVSYSNPKISSDSIKVVGYADYQPLYISSRHMEYKNTKGASILLSDSIVFRANASSNKRPLVLLNDKKMGHASADEINSYKAHEAIILDGLEASKKYGDEAKDGVLLLYTKSEPELPGGIGIQNVPNDKKPLMIVNGKIEPHLDINSINPNEIEKIEVIKDFEAVIRYGEQAKNGVVIVTRKGFKEVAASNGLLIVPNPASYNVDVTLKGNDVKSKLVEVRVYNKFGEEVFNGKKTGPTFTLSVSDMPTNGYILVVIDGTNKYTGAFSVVH